LLFNGAGMIQFKPYFRGAAKPSHKRLTTAQKCVRTGDIDIVGDLTHLTFFEMLGNFSFGDYFKKEAIALSWEFITDPQWLGLDPRRVSFTIFEEDDEAYEYWAEWLEKEGIDPATRIFRLDEETNYWPAGSFTKGPPGPCGPNSEMFYWTRGEPPSAPYTRDDWIRDEAASRWLEFWNDVFIQFEWQGELRSPSRPQEGYVKTGMPPLPFRSVDTGMGLERTAAVLGGLTSLYDIDIFQPILRQIEEVVGKNEASTKPERPETPGEEALSSLDPSSLPYRYGSDPAKDVATRIIADHIRTAVFCIADGVLPGNSGRGYVLRRLIRRAVLKGQRGLGIRQPFFHHVYEGVVEAMGDHYRELRERREIIVETLRNEEALFRRTLEAGTEVLQRELSLLSHQSESELPGEIAFRLYDTYGFPLEVTKELCAEAGVEVDEVGYEKALGEAQERSRKGTERATVYGGVESNGLDVPPTVFRGYDEPRTVSHIVAVQELPESQSDPSAESKIKSPYSQTVAIALDQTPFYAESGGQVADTGVIAGEGFEGRVVNVTKRNGVFVHEVVVERDERIKDQRPREETIDQGPETPGGEGLSSLDLSSLPSSLPESLQGLEVEARIDFNRRMRIMRNHTATHLLHAALRQVLGKHVTQAGSYVGPDHLRFDFTHGKPMTPEEVARVEFIVNEQALWNAPVRVYADVPIDEARARGAMALFGEKYGDRVRMIEIADFSRELCGGTHLRSTGEIGLFKITSESSAASGVRRIEAVTGEGAYAWVLEQTGLFYEAASRLRTSPRDVLQAIDRLQDQVRDERRKREKAETALARGDSGGTAETQEIKGVFLWTRKFEGVDPKVAASAVDDAVAQNPNLVALCAVVGERIQLICKAGPAAVAKGAHAGNLIKQAAPIVGGGGGGRPEFATAGGKDASKVDAALAAASAFLDAML